MPRTKRGIWKRKASPYWMISYTDRHGRRHCVSSGTRVYAEAKAKMQAIRSGEVEVIGGRHIPTIGSFIPTFIDSMIANGRRPRTIETARISLNRVDEVMGQKKLHQVGPEEIDRYKNHRQTTGASPYTVNRELTLLGGLLRKAAEYGLAPEPSFQIAKLPLEKRSARPTLTERNRWRLLKGATNPRDRMFVMLALQTGLRRTELTWLTWDDLDEEHGEIVVRPKQDGQTRWMPKNRQERRIPLTTAFLTELRAYHLKQRPVSRWVLPGAHGERFRSPSKAIRRIFQRAGLYKPGVTLHGLRHTFASEALAAGVDLETVRELLGHADITTTQIYTHTTRERKREAIRKLDLGLFASESAAKNAAVLHMKRSTKKVGKDK